jgi:hypothetical protein
MQTWIYGNLELSQTLNKGGYICAMFYLSVWLLSFVNGRRVDRLIDYRHIWNLSMKLRVKEKIRFMENWGLQIYRDCIILFSNELSLHLKQYMYDYWSIKLFSDILCDSLTTNKFQIVISKNPMLVIWIFFCTILNCTINILIYWELYMYLYYL